MQSSFSMPERGICAHRGDRAACPENTVVAIRSAVGKGAAMVEFDVARCKTGELVVMHDSTVDRTTDGHGAIADLTFAEIRSLDAGIRRGEQFRGTKIPTFDEMIDAVPKEGVWINVHCKSDCTAEVALGIKAKGRLHQAFIAASDDGIAAARAAVPEVMACQMGGKWTWWTREETVEYMARIASNGVQFAQPHWCVFNSRDCGAFHKAGGKLNFYWVDEPERLPAVMSAGVDFPLTNNLDVMLDAYGKWVKGGMQKVPWMNPERSDDEHAAHFIAARSGERDYRGICPSDADGRVGLRNPERGWRFEIGVGMIPGDPCKLGHVTDHWPFPRYEDDGATIAQAYCYLCQFANSEISDEKIAALEADFAHARKDGVKFLLRFAYDYPPSVMGSPCVERILAHIAQLKPVIRRNIDVVYTLQIGWVGAWGEFHSSLNGVEKDPASVAAVVGATLDMLPEGHFTMMRRIAYKENALKALGADVGEVTAANAFSNDPTARIGFFNDGTLANWWDGGTFVGEPYAQPGQHEFDRVMREGVYVPVDGELFWVGDGGGHYEDFANGLRAIVRFSQQHYSTFSLVHSFSELDKTPRRSTIDFWRDTPVTKDILDDFGVFFDPDYFDGVPYRTAYDFIRDHLGYRLAVKHARFGEIAPGAEFEASADLINYGFSTPFKERHAEYVIVASDGKVTELGDALDCRKLLPRTAAVAEWKGTLPEDLGAAPYSLALWLPDRDGGLRYRPEYAVRLASRLEERVVGGRRLNML